MATVLLPSGASNPNGRLPRPALWMGVMLVLAGGVLAPASGAEKGTDREASLAYEPVAGWDAPPRVPGRLAPAHGALMGVHSDDSTNMSPEEQGIVKLEAALGRHMDINNHYHGEWDSIAEDGLSWLEEWDVESGRIPLVGWGCHDSNKIISGSEDDIIRRTARNMKAFGHEFFMRYCWEMDGARKQGTVKGPDKFNEAWRRMYRIFQEEGATNVIWVWTANAAGFKDRRKYSNNEPPGPYFYPGDEYVDWIAADGYNWGVSKRNQGDRWRQVLEIFDEFMVFARQHPKPIMIGEYGAQEQREDPAAKPEWMRHAHETLINKPKTPECRHCGAFSDVAAVVYFDVDYGSHGDWRIMSSDATLAAFKEAADDPWFNQLGTVSWPGFANRTRPAGQAAPKPSQDPSTAPPDEEVDQAEPPAPESGDGTEAETAPPPDQSTTQSPNSPPSDQSTTQSEGNPPPDQSTTQSPNSPPSDQSTTQSEGNPPPSDQSTTQPEPNPPSDQSTTQPDPTPPPDDDQRDEAKPDRERRSESDGKKTRSKTRQQKTDRTAESKTDRSGDEDDRSGDKDDRSADKDDRKDSDRR